MKWSSFHIYHSFSFEQFFYELLKPLLDLLFRNKYITSYFFTRYWENGQHIRLRILMANMNLTEDTCEFVLSQINIYYKNKNLDKLHNYVEVKSYIPEIARYGDKELMYIAEKHFEYSSRIVLQLITSNYRTWSNSSAITFAIKMQIIFSMVFFKKKEVSIKFFKFFYKNWLPHSIKSNVENTYSEVQREKILIFFQNSYLKQKNKLIPLMKYLYDKKSVQQWERKWEQFCLLNSESLFEVKEQKKVYNLFNKNTELNENAFFSICESYIHMTNNRLGIYLRDEAFIAYLIYMSLKDT